MAKKKKGSDGLEAVRTAMLAAVADRMSHRESRQWETASAWLADHEMQLKAGLAVGGNACPGCSGRDEALVLLTRHGTILEAAGMSNVIMIGVFNHHRGVVTDSVALSIEGAKQFVNRIGEVITAAEHVAAVSEGR